MYGDLNVSSMISPGLNGLVQRAVSPDTTSVPLYQYSSTLSSAIDPLDMFLTLMVVTMSLPTFLDALGMIWMAAMPLTGL